MHRWYVTTLKHDGSCEGWGYEVQRCIVLPASRATENANFNQRVRRIERERLQMRFLHSRFKTSIDGCVDSKCRVCGSVKARLGVLLCTI